jgi:hypothetical protein
MTDSESILEQVRILKEQKDMLYNALYVIMIWVNTRENGIQQPIRDQANRALKSVEDK